MSKKATLRTKWLRVAPRWAWAAGVMILLPVVLLPAPAYAHGMEGQEIGPPILTSGILGFLCYWLVMLWPSAKKTGEATPRPGREHLRGTRVKRPPRLRKIAGQIHTASLQPPQRKASDG